MNAISNTCINERPYPLCPYPTFGREMEIAQWFVRQQLLQPARFALVRHNETARIDLSFSWGDAHLIGASQSKAV